MDKEKKVKAGLIVTIAVLVIALIGVIAYFMRGGDFQPNQTVIRLTKENERLETALEAQKSLTDSLNAAALASKQGLTPDTVYVLINSKYDEKINTVRVLPADEQVRILAGWLPKADSL